MEKIKNIIPKIFILDIFIGILLVGLGIYFSNNWFLGLGALSIAIGLYNPHKRILNKVNKKLGKV